MQSASPMFLMALLGMVHLGCVADDGVISLYEDDQPFEGGPADGYGLETLFSVQDYETELEGRLVEESLQTNTFGDELTLEPGARLVILRTLTFEGEDMAVIADDHTFELYLISMSELESKTREAADSELGGYGYLAALERTRNAVLCHLHPSALANEPNATLRPTITVDMCQSRREWEGEFYEWMVSLGDRTGQPQSVGVVMTGLWAHRHFENFRQLVTWQREGRLDIRWINHSYHHQLSQDSSGTYWFLTDQDVDLTKEALDLEMLLLRQGVMFSPLFRFPGLTHDRRTLAELNDLGLFPLDADGWVAKGEPIEDGSVVLLHGNGNERAGIEMFMDFMEPREQDIIDGGLRFMDPLGVLPVPAPTGEAPAADLFFPCAP